MSCSDVVASVRFLDFSHSTITLLALLMDKIQALLLLDFVTTISAIRSLTVIQISEIKPISLGTGSEPKKIVEPHRNSLFSMCNNGGTQNV